MTFLKTLMPSQSIVNLRPPSFEFSLKTADLAARQHLSGAHNLPQREGFDSFFTENS